MAYNWILGAGQKGKGPKIQHSRIGFIPFSEIQQATNKFSHIIGSGGFGKVYKGVLKGSGIKVAVKRKDPNSSQGQKEFQVEIELLPGLKLDHPNLVSLIGYCDEKNEMILVYEYIEKGTLKSHLYGSDKPPLSWVQRLEICVGAAKGLHYLHTSSPNGIIHRDVKSENILLDEDLCGKVGDFGLSKSGPELNQTHVITHVKGTPGYLDPEYFQTQQLTEKSDVYSFGVVLLEVLCGRPVIDHKLSAEKVSLVSWGKKMLVEDRVKEIVFFFFLRMVKEIVDPKISGTIHPRSLMIFGNIVSKCLAQDSKERPSMGELLRDLEQELEYIHAESSVAGNSNSRSLTRSLGKVIARTANPAHVLSTPSTRLAQVSPVLYGNTMDGIVELDESGNELSSQAIDEGERKALTRCAHIMKSTYMRRDL